MSMKLMVRVLEEADLPRPQQAVLVAMAENASDDGSHCYPSVDLIAWKAGYKPRAVSDIMRDLRKAGILEVIRESTAQRPTEYWIHLEHAPRKLTFQEWQNANGRYRERGPYKERETRETAPVQNDGNVERDAISRVEGCNLTYLGMQSHVIEIRENASEPVREPVEPVKEPVRDGAAAKNVVFIAAPSAPDADDSTPVEKPKAKPRTRKSETPFPDDMALTPERLAYALEQGMSEVRTRRQFERFHNHALATDRRQKDWDASWRNWVLGEIDRYGRDIRTADDDPSIDPSTGKPYPYNHHKNPKAMVG